MAWTFDTRRQPPLETDFGAYSPHKSFACKMKSRHWRRMTYSVELSTTNANSQHTRHLDSNVTNKKFSAEAQGSARSHTSHAQLNIP